MVGGHRFTMNPYPDLELTQDDRKQVVKIAKTLVGAKLAEYQDYLDNHKSIDLTRWKKYLTKGSTTTYIEHVNSNPDCNFPASLMVGSLQGSLDENMFGLLCPTLESMRIKSSYLKDSNTALVLATIAKPTLEEPFHSIVVKWLEIAIPGASTGLIRNRDYVFLEATGFRNLRNGNRVGYHLLQSITFRQTHELPTHVRGYISMCGMFHEEAPNRTHCRGTGIMDLKGGVARVLGIQGLVKATMAGLKYSYCSQMKKLAWLLNVKYTQRSERAMPAFKPECITCKTKVKANLGRRKTTCSLCFHAICGSCEIVKKMSFIAVDKELVQYKMKFCSRCMLEAARLDTREAARVEFVHRYSRNYIIYEPPEQSSFETSNSNSTSSSYGQPVE